MSSFFSRSKHDPVAIVLSAPQLEALSRQRQLLRARLHLTDYASQMLLNPVRRSAEGAVAVHGHAHASTRAALERAGLIEPGTFATLSALGQQEADRALTAACGLTALEVLAAAAEIRERAEAAERAEAVRIARMADAVREATGQDGCTVSGTKLLLTGDAARALLELAGAQPDDETQA